MEGDVLTAGLGLPALLAVGGTVIGGVFALLKWFAARLLEDIDQRLRRIDEVEARMDRLLAELPLYYQRREDSIRELTSVNTKFDRIYELLARRHDA
jgi:DNA-binding transcriptional regulator GbsR (MarR family)